MGLAICISFHFVAAPSGQEKQPNEQDCDIEIQSELVDFSLLKEHESTKKPRKKKKTKKKDDEELEICSSTTKDDEEEFGIGKFVTTSQLQSNL